jgi:hypothetical protein
MHVIATDVALKASAEFRFTKTNSKAKIVFFYTYPQIAFKIAASQVANGS